MRGSDDRRPVPVPAAGGPDGYHGVDHGRRPLGPAWDGPAGCGSLRCVGTRRLPDAAERERARSRTIPDVLPGPGDPPPRVLFCGINPGLVSAATGRHFACPGNRFWPVLHASGFTPRLLRPDEQDELPRWGLGITNMAPRATARADELTDHELREGGERLRRLVAELAPAWLAVVGIGAYRTAFGRRDATVGEQDDRLGDTGVWVLPNPSGLNAHWSREAMTAEFARLRARS